MKNFCIDRCDSVTFDVIKLATIVARFIQHALKKPSIQARWVLCFWSITCLDINAVVTWLPFVTGTEGAQKEQKHNYPETR